LRSPCTIFAFEKKNGHQIINISVEFLLLLQQSNVLLLFNFFAECDVRGKEYVIPDALQL